MTLPGGDVVKSENRYRFAYHRDLGALVDNYLGQTFLISRWASATNWIKHIARYSVESFVADADWRAQFFPIGGMMDSEHPAMAMLLDRHTGRTDGSFPTLVEVDQLSCIDVDGQSVTLVDGKFFFSAQGINFDRSDQTPVNGKLWIDESGFVAKATYDITAAYSKNFGAVRAASLTTVHREIRTTAPATSEALSLFSFEPRAQDVRRELSQLFAAPSSSDEDDGSASYLINRTAPLFTGEKLGGGLLSLAELRGQRVLLFFWATWCPNCSREMAAIEVLSKAALDNTVVVGVNVDSSVGPGVLESYYDDRGLSFTSILDHESAIASKYRTIAIPSVYVVDSLGLLRRVDFGVSRDLIERYAEILGDVP